jgi:UDP-glucose:(heptosyl)LPS alpha-1,3-glucosyltransferase
LKALFLKKLLSPKNLFFLHADRVLFQNHPGLKVAALSRMTAVSIQKRHGRTGPRISVIPNGVELTRFHPGLREAHGRAVREELDIPGKCRVVLFVAHNFRLKGLKEGIDGLAEYRNQGGDPVLVVAGRGRKSSYEAQSRRLGLEGRVRFLGTAQRVERLLGAADLLLHPTYYDPCSLVVLEAFGAGVPVLTTRYNGAAELMAGGRGGLVLDHPRDRAGMADALGTLLQKERLDGYQGQAAALGRENDFERHVGRLEEWLLTS